MEEPTAHRLGRLYRRTSRIDPNDVSGESALSAPRILGELRKLGIGVNQSTVAKYMSTHELLERHNVSICLHDMEGAALEASAIGSF